MFKTVYDSCRIVSKKTNDHWQVMKAVLFLVFSLVFSLTRTLFVCGWSRPNNFVLRPAKLKLFHCFTQNEAEPYNNIYEWQRRFQFISLRFSFLIRGYRDNFIAHEPWAINNHLSASWRAYLSIQPYTFIIQTCFDSLLSRLKYLWEKVWNCCMHNYACGYTQMLP